MVSSNSEVKAINIVIERRGTSKITSDGSGEEETDEDEGKTTPVKDRAQGAAGSAAARRWTEDVAVRARAALAYQPRGRPPSNVVRPNQPYDVAARALAALRDYGPDRNPRVVQDYGMESDEEANSKATPPPSVDGGVWVDDDAQGGQSRGQNQVSAGLFDSSEVFVSTAVGKTQGKTRQRGSAANFLPGTAAGGELKGKYFVIKACLDRPKHTL